MPEMRNVLTIELSGEQLDKIREELEEKFDDVFGGVLEEMSKLCEPFLKLGEEAEQNSQRRDDNDVVYAFNSASVTYGDFRRLAAFIKGEEK